MLWACFLFLSGCGTIFGPSVAETPAEAEQKVLKIVNGYRVNRGFAELTWNEGLAEIARGHSREMAAGTCPVGHDGFEDRIAAVNVFLPWKKIAENVAFADGVEKAVDGWIQSADHQIHLVGDYTLTGVGVSVNEERTAFYITQVFVLPKGD